MTLFPSIFEKPSDVSKLLYYAAVWSGKGASEVWIQGYSTLQTHVTEISRSPSGGRVENLSKILNFISSNRETSMSLSPDMASSLFSACLSEAPALLELGYPRDEPTTFTTTFPGPAVNSIRTRNQIRSAIHHLGGDMELFKILLRSSGSTDTCLDIMFAIWPPQRIQEGKFMLRLGYPGQTVPAVMILDERLAGYILLSCWDLALRLRDIENIQTTVPDFRSFSMDAIITG